MSITSKDYFRYLPVSEGDRLWGLYVTGLGCMEISPGDHYPPGVHPDLYQFTWPQKRVLPEYQLLYIPVGDGQFESASAGKRRIAGGAVFLTFPGDWHRYSPSPAIGWAEYWIGFAGEVADRLVERGILSPAEPVFSTGRNELIQSTFQRLIECVREEPPGCQQLLAAGALEILGAALAAERVGPRGGRHAQWIREAKRLLTEGPEEPLTIEQIASRFHLSEAQFRRVFRQHFGVSPYQYYQEVRVNRAKELLSGTIMSIKEISAALHFENPYHFSKAFKKRTGMSPSEWRRGP